MSELDKAELSKSYSFISFSKGLSLLSLLFCFFSGLVLFSLSDISPVFDLEYSLLSTFSSLFEIGLFSKGFSSFGCSFFGVFSSGCF